MTTGIAGPCIKEPIELVDIIKCIPGCENYEDTSNVLYRAIDRAAIMELLQISIGRYVIGRLKDSNKDIIKRKKQQEQYQREKIPFEQIVAMTYEELVEYLRAKYGPVKYDYFPIESKNKIDELDGLFNIRIKRGNIIYYQGAEYPVGIKNALLVDDDLVDYTHYMEGNQKRNILESDIYWYYPEEELYIVWKRNRYNSRVAEGLVIHHIDEDKAEKLSDPRWACDYPVAYQRKERLVYCDFIEHYLLHLKCESKCGTKLIENDIQKFILREIDQKWQIPCARRVWAREKDVDLLVEKGMIFQEDKTDES